MGEIRIIGESGCVRGFYAQGGKRKDASFAREGLMYDNQLGLIPNHVS